MLLRQIFTNFLSKVPAIEEMSTKISLNLLSEKAHCKIIMDQGIYGYNIEDGNVIQIVAKMGNLASWFVS